MARPRAGGRVPGPLRGRLPPPALIWPRTTGVLFDDSDLERISRIQGKHNTPCVNPPGALAILRDKGRQFEHLRALGHPVLPFVPMGGLLETPGQVAPLPPGGPFLVKTLRGNRGLGQHRLPDFPSLRAFWNGALERGDQRYLVQERLRDFREFRILLAGDAHLATVEKGPPPSGHLRSKGRAPWRGVHPPPKLLGLARNLMADLSLDFAAVEIVETGGRPFVLEINAIPGWEGMERACRPDLSRAIVDAVASLKGFEGGGSP